MSISQLVLTSSVWRFSRVDGEVGTESMTFLPDGTIAGYANPNERAWRIDNDRLHLLNDSGDCTTIFDQVPSMEAVILEGDFLADRAIRLRLERLSAWPQFFGSTKFHLEREILAYGWSIGDHSYGHPLVLEPRDAQLSIGKYTSIGPNVCICLSNHDIANVSSYPFASLRDHWPGTPATASDHASRGDVRIGSDVWIGAHAFICPGVTIADGAVIAAYSVVTRSVAAYAVAGGNPARTIRHRFAPTIVQRLQRLGWWNWRDETVNAMLPLIVSHDVETFLEHAEGCFFHAADLNG